MTLNGTETNSTVNSTIIDNNSTLNVSNETNSTSNGTIVDNSTSNGTVVDNSTTNGTAIVNSTGSTGTVDLFVNYVLPSGCLFTDATNTTIRCSSGNARGVTFTLAQVKEYFNITALEVCADYSSVASSCTSNTVINDMNTCLRLSLYNKFQLAQETVFYGWLSYDVVARNTLFGRCQSQSSSFTAVSEKFSASFSFDFPNIN